MYKYACIFFLALLLGCSSGKEILKEQESFTYSVKASDLQYSFQVDRKGKVVYVGTKGVATKGRVNFSLDSGMKEGIWTHIDDLKPRLLPQESIIQTADTVKEIKYLFQDKNGVFIYSGSPEGFEQIDVIFDAMLNYPMRQ